MTSWAPRLLTRSGRSVLAMLYFLSVLAGCGSSSPDSEDDADPGAGGYPVPTSTEGVRAAIHDIRESADALRVEFEGLQADAALLESYIATLDFDAWDAYWAADGLERMDRIAALAQELAAREAVIADVQGPPIEAIPGWGQQRGALEICVVTIAAAGLAVAALATSIRSAMDDKSAKLEAIRARVKAHYLAKGQDEAGACAIADAWAIKGVPLSMLGVALDSSNSILQTAASQAAPIIPSVTKTGEVTVTAIGFVADGSTVVLNHQGSGEGTQTGPLSAPGAFEQAFGAQQAPAATFIGRVQGGVIPNVPEGKWEGNFYPVGAAPLRLGNLNVKEGVLSGAIITGQPLDEIDCGPPDVVPVGSEQGEGDPGEGGTAATGWQTVSYTTLTGSMGTDSAGAPIQLSGTPARPTISWDFTGAQTLSVIDFDSAPMFGIESLDESDEGIALYIGSPVDYGDYSVPLTAPLHGGGASPDLEVGHTYTFAISDWSDQVAILVATLQ